MKKLLTRNDLPAKGRVNIDLLNATTEEEIEAIAKEENLPYGFWKNTKLVLPEKKVLVSLRVDSETLARFKAAGDRYQSRMNAVLKRYAEEVL